MLRSRSVFPFASPLSAQAESLETTLLDGSLASARPASTDIHRRGDRGMFANLKTLSKRTLKATSLTIAYPFYGTTKTRPTRAKPKPEAAPPTATPPHAPSPPAETRGRTKPPALARSASSHQSLIEGPMPARAALPVVAFRSKPRMHVRTSGHRRVYTREGRARGASPRLLRAPGSPVLARIVAAPDREARHDRAPARQGSRSERQSGRTTCSAGHRVRARRGGPRSEVAGGCGAGGWCAGCGFWPALMGSPVLARIGVCGRLGA